jgi:hypothetical protein
LHKFDHKNIIKLEGIVRDFKPTNSKEAGMVFFVLDVTTNNQTNNINKQQNAQIQNIKIYINKTNKQTLINTYKQITYTNKAKHR